MAKVFRPSTREASILSKIESQKEYARRQAINKVKDGMDNLANAISMKLIENKLIETDNKDAIEEQFIKCLEKLTRMDDFDIDYQIAPIRNLVPQPHVVSLFLTSFVIEKLIDHRNVVDIFGSDEDIYFCINKEVAKLLA